MAQIEAGPREGEGAGMSDTDTQLREYEERLEHISLWRIALASLLFLVLCVSLVLIVNILC